MKSPDVLWKDPIIHPITKKAHSIPVLNPINVYGRVFFFAWFGFCVAFWSWYAFPPLLGLTIAKDIGLTPVDVANSNIVALLATLLVRLVSGPSCDRFGPRKTFAACLLLGSIPTVLAGTVTNAGGLITLRFFIGILGGSFVPCQVWSTGFFDKNVVGTANALTGGWGNAGGGITYFLMPAIFDSLVLHHGLTAHVAWRVTFIVPFIVIIATAVGMLLTCPDTPTGDWSERLVHAQQNLASHTDHAVVELSESTANAGTETNDQKSGEDTESSGEKSSDDKDSDDKKTSAKDTEAKDKKEGSDKKTEDQADGKKAHETKVDEKEMKTAVTSEIVQKPTFKEALPVIFSLQTLVLGACYFNSFGAELAINSILGSYYLKNFPSLGQTGTGLWAAMFGLLNIFARPLGGIISDVLYRYTESLWVKKFFIHFLGIITGAFLLAIGFYDPHEETAMFGLFGAMAIFLEAGNGAIFSLVPHVHPHANGIVSGVTGATGNLGGIIFAIVFRYNTTNYSRSIWIIGIICIAMHLAISWIRPIPKNQVGGR